MSEFEQYNLPVAMDEPQTATQQQIDNTLFASGVFPREHKSANYQRGKRGWRLNAAGSFDLGLILTIQDITALQDSIDTAGNAGGGIVNLAPGTYSYSKNITIPSNVTLNGNGSTIDFGGGAYQILIQGTNAYSTGTLAVNNGSTAIVGTGTTWTSAMIGRNILIGEYWYEITAVADTTHLTIASNFLTTNVTGATYVIATTIDNVGIENINLEDSSVALIKFIYVNEIDMFGVSCYNGLIGIDGDDSAFVRYVNSFVDLCGTGITLDNVNYGTFFDWNITASTTGGAIIINKTINTAFEVWALADNTGGGFKISNSNNVGIENFSIKETTGIGMEFSAGNSDTCVSDGTVDKSSSDGIKLTATSDAVIILGNNIKNNGGYGVNIAASSCDNNILSSNDFSSNSSGDINDSGTGTIIVGNSPIALNTSTVNMSGNQTVAGVKTFSSDPLIPDEAYGSGWNGVLEPPTKNAVYDKIETLQGKFAAPTTGLSAGTNYQAAADGFIFGDCNDNNANPKWEIYTDSSSTPTTLVMKFNQETSGVEDRPFCCPIKKNNYYRLDVTNCTVTRYAFMGFSA